MEAEHLRPAQTPDLASQLSLLADDLQLDAQAPRLIERIEVGRFNPFAITNSIPQPGFPTEDLYSQNAEVFGFMIHKNPGVLSLSRFYQEHQRALHAIATYSLQKHDHQLDTTPETYEGFTLGFSVIDAISVILHNGTPKLRFSVRQFQELLPGNPYPEVSSKSIARQLLAERDKAWHEDPSEALLELDSYSASPLMDELKQQQLAQRNVDWPDKKPQTFRMVSSLAAAHRRKSAFVGGAVLGAQVAAELQDPTIAV